VIFTKIRTCSKKNKKENLHQNVQLQLSNHCQKIMHSKGDRCCYHLVIFLFPNRTHLSPTINNKKINFTKKTTKYNEICEIHL